MKDTAKTFPLLTKSLLAMLGPSVVFVALSLNGGELLLWPSLVANFGLGILWPLLIILGLQFIVNIEIERYTLVTGKNVESGLVKNKVWLSAIFTLTVIAALVWPAWMTTAGNLLAVISSVPLGMERNAGLVLAIILLLSALVVFKRPNIYPILEKITRAGLAIALSIILIVVVVKFDAGVFWEGIKGIFNFGYIPAGLPRFDFVAALAYGGVAGVLNLVQSEWIANKGYGAASLSEGTKVELDSEESRTRFKKWFAFINKEHALLFVAANILSIFLLAYLGRILLPQGTAQGFGVIKAEIRALNDFIPYLGSLFGLGGTIIFIMANLTILDAIGRLLAKILAPLATQKSDLLKSIGTSPHNRLSMYAAMCGVLILLLSLLVPAFKQPFFLLVLSACLSAFTMWLYPPLLLQLNYSLPKAARPSLWRSILVVFCAVGYGFVTLWALSEYVPLWALLIPALGVTAYHARVIWNIRT